MFRRNIPIPILIPSPNTRTLAAGNDSVVCDAEHLYHPKFEGSDWKFCGELEYMVEMVRATRNHELDTPENPPTGSHLQHKIPTS